MNKKILIWILVFIFLLSLLFLFYNTSLFSNNTYEKNSINYKVNKQKEENKYNYNVDHWFNSWNIVNIEINASEKEYELIPWIKTKMYTYNSDWDIRPLVIKIKKWDKLNVNFNNLLNKSSTIHWHWVRLPNSQDWVPWITQDTVKPWGNFDYSFIANDAWTFLFHPHDNHSEQIWKWLYGVLIVEDDSIKTKYDKDLTWVLKDYRVGKDWKLTNDFPNMHDAMHWWRMWNLVTINNIVNFSEEVKWWELIRLRLANMSNARTYRLNLWEFDSKVIATDDSLINNPQHIDELEISPWERYQLEIKIPNDKNKLVLYDNYYSRSYPVAIANININWVVKETKSSITPKWNIPDWTNMDYNKPDIVIDLWWMWVMWGDKSMMMWMWWERWWTINDWIFPTSNTPIKLKKGKMYIIRMVNKSKRDHPMHLHWDFFQVVNINWMKWNLIWFKDTVNVKPLSYVDVAIIPTNPWIWAFHCHILEHADLWMFTTVIVEE